MTIPEMKANGATTKEIVKRLIDVYTGERPCSMFWTLTGNAKAGARAHIMSEIMGVKMPKSKSGITVIREKLLDMFGVLEDDCIAVVNDNLFKAMGYKQ